MSELFNMTEMVHDKMKQELKDCEESSKQCRERIDKIIEELKQIREEQNKKTLYYSKLIKEKRNLLYKLEVNRNREKKVRNDLQIFDDSQNM